jgi:hypothetical protein
MPIPIAKPTVFEWVTFTCLDKGVMVDGVQLVPGQSITLIGEHLGYSWGWTSRRIAGAVLSAKTVPKEEGSARVL